MFGYVNVYKPELKMKDFYQFKAYYCGLCLTLKERYGSLGQMTLTYDMTFLVVLLASLYESETRKEQHRCMVHPMKKHDMLINEVSAYAADMNILLTYHHFVDDWEDERSIPGITGAKLLKRTYRKLEKQYPDQSVAIKKALDQLAAYEKNNETNLDLVSGCFGELMAELTLFRKDMWQETLRRLGFFLGKYIYIMDAYEDLPKDIKNNSYNPLKALSQKANYKETCEEMLTMMMAECSNAFEQLPCIRDIDILRNILYQGVWTKFDEINKPATEGTKV